jgi:cytochrome c biogenesis protein CcdA
MLRLIGLVVSIGIADSLNPTTIAPALYLASGDHARARVTEFTLAVFGVYLLGGIAIALGPGQLLLSIVPHPGRRLSYGLEIVAGVAMLTAAAFLWGYRDRLGSRERPETRIAGRSSLVLGATITAIELPTAFPYFAAIAAIVGSDQGIPRELMLLVLFNLCFIAPLLAIVATLAYAGPDAVRLLARWRSRLEARWPAVLAILALIAGVLAILLGATGFGSTHRNDFGTFSRRVRKLLRLHP